jgi:predicted ATPase/DNA-binding SARP family transcriptional activator
MLTLKIELLGPPQITVGSHPVATDRHKAIGLLAYLAVEARPCRRESLATLLWPDYPRASAFSYLRRTVWELNRVLGEGWISSDRELVSLVHEPGLSVDVEAYQCYLSPTVNGVKSLMEAVELYRGDFLEGLVIADTAPFEEWQIQQAEYYRREFGHILERLVTALEQAGEHDQALPYIQRWMALDRFNESAARAAMRQMARTADRSGVIHHYQSLTQLLDSELGIAPQKETQELYQSILREDAVGKAPERSGVPGDGTKPKPAANLPQPATAFIGRGNEIEQVKRFILDPEIRLLTLTGPGGTGKTRLSLQAATETAEMFSDGAWFIPLAAVKSSQGLVQAAAKGLNFLFQRRDNPSREQLLDYLRDKQLLLILDNFEHLLGGGEELVTEILEAARGVNLLVTSRQRLNLLSEHVFSVPGMAVPEENIVAGWDDPERQSKPYSAIRLLVESAHRVRPDFKLTQDNKLAVTRICQLVEGSPLGIELAVAWLQVLPPEEVAEEIRRSFDFLETDAADVPDRQRSLRAIFDSSWKMLTPDEQLTFRRLCAFRGGFTRQAAQDVIGASLRTLLSLANKSWITQDDRGRYQLHEVLRQFGLERLQSNPAEWQEVKGRHAEYFANYLSEQGQILHTSDQLQAIQRLTNEIDSNIPDAWDWLLDNGQTDLLIEKMLTGIFIFWLMNYGPEEFISLVKRTRHAISHTGERESTLMHAVLEVVEITLELNHMMLEDRPRERLEALWSKVKTLHLQEEMGFWYTVLVITYGNEVNAGEAYHNLKEMLPRVKAQQDAWVLGNVYLFLGIFNPSGEIGTRKEHLENALAIFERLGVVRERNNTLRALAEHSIWAKDYNQALVYYQAAHQIFEQSLKIHDLQSIDRDLAEYDLYIYMGKIEHTIRLFEQNKKFYEEIGSLDLLAGTLSWESLALSRYGDLDDALVTRIQGLEVARRLKNQNHIAWHLWELGEIYRLKGDFFLAQKNYDEAMPLFERLQDVPGLGFYKRGRGDIALMQGKWQEAQVYFQEALELHQKVQRNVKNWGLIYYRSKISTALVHQGEMEAAKEHLITAMHLAKGWAHPDIIALALGATAIYLAAKGMPAQAIEVAACVARQHSTWREVKRQAEDIIQSAWQDLTVAEAQGARERGEAWDIDALLDHYLNNGLP